jgi:hypothetical protein
MHEELWQGIQFKLAEAQFFLDQMGKVLVPPERSPLSSPRSWGEPARWQPDFYFYLDAFLGAARSVPDVIQKCFGWDCRSKDKWPQPLDAEETDRRKKYQAEFTALYGAFLRQPLSGIRVGTFHWSGMPSVQTKAKGFGGQEYTGKPGEPIPSVAPRHFPPGTDPAFLAIFSTPLPVEPSWNLFTVEILQPDGTTKSDPLFPACRAYLSAAQQIVNDANGICERVHLRSKLTAPLPVSRENGA